MPSHKPKSEIPHPRNYFCKENLRHIWKYSRESDQKAAGHDGITPKKFRDSLDSQICAISGKLDRTGYHFNYLRTELIPKGNGKFRVICIPTVRDRLVQRLLLNLLTHPDHFGVLNGVSYGTYERGLQAALDEAVKKRNKSPWVIKTDITSFFDSIDRPRLITLLEKKLKGKKKLRLLPLLKQVVNCEIYINNRDHKKELEGCGIITGRGLRQGMPLSPFLANVFLKKFDAFVIKKFINTIRYVDDIVIFCNSEKECNAKIKLIKKLLKDLSLEIPEINLANSKTSIVAPDEPVIFLGIELYKHKNGNYGKRIPNIIVDNLLSEREISSGLEDLNYPKIIELFENKERGYRSSYKDTTNLNTVLAIYKENVAKVKKDLIEKKIGKELYEKLDSAMRKFLGIE